MAEAEAGFVDRFVDRLLWALDDTGAAADELETLVKVAIHLPQQSLSDTVCDLSFVLHQLRAWYCEPLGLVVLALLERVAGLATRLPSPSTCKTDPSLAVLRVLEGVLLLCTVQHARERVVGVLEQLVRKRRVPSCSFVRLEAALVCLSGHDWPGQPHRLPLDTKRHESFLADMADGLRPDEDALCRIHNAKRALEQAVKVVFPGCTPQYFGSMENGFNTRMSDVDCVIKLSDEDMAKLQEMSTEEHSRQQPSGEGGQRRACASAATRVLADALHTQESLQALGLRVREVITEARVPVLKCDSAEGVAVDVSFNNTLPLYNSRLLRTYAELDDLVGRLGRLVKLWAKNRRVNDALDGTLSSYSHILLLIHYLQRIRLVPNLQDKSYMDSGDRDSHGNGKLIDGKHDVWFLDPSTAPVEKLDRWVKTAPEDATLHGLLAGFFYYYAYEFPVHSQVVSIRDPRGCVPKLEHFQALVAARSAAEADEEPDEEVLMTTPTLETEDGDDAPGPDTVPEKVQESWPANGDKQQSLQKRRLLTPEEQAVQQQLSGRQVLCIDDPMELGRTLGTSFQGMERLAYELRRGCQLLGEGGRQHLSQLFADQPPPAKTIWKLVDQWRLQNIFVEHKLVLPVPQPSVGFVLGKGGGRVKEMQSAPGITSIRVDDTKNPPELRITGMPQAVRSCFDKVKQLLAEREEREQPAPQHEQTPPQPKQPPQRDPPQGSYYHRPTHPSHETQHHRPGYPPHEAPSGRRWGRFSTGKPSSYGNEAYNRPAGPVDPGPAYSARVWRSGQKGDPRDGRGIWQ